MDTLQFVLIVILLVVIAAILLTIAFKPKTEYTIGLNDSLDAKLDRLAKAAAHHVDVNVVLALTEQFKRDPQLIQNLAGYSNQVVDAALTYRVNSLGSDLEYIDDELSDAREMLADHPSPNGQHFNHYQGIVTSLEALRSNVQKQLEEAAGLVNERAKSNV